MRIFSFILLLFIGFSSQAQKKVIIENDLISNRVTLADDNNPENNSGENATFRIGIRIYEDYSGMVTVQDLRETDKPFIYNIENLIDKGNHDGITFFLYKAQAIHITPPIETELMVYFNTEDKMKLMINHDSFSIVFHDLK